MYSISEYLFGSLTVCLPFKKTYIVHLSVSGSHRTHSVTPHVFPSESTGILISYRASLESNSQEHIRVMKRFNHCIWNIIHKKFHSPKIFCHLDVVNTDKLLGEVFSLGWALYLFYQAYISKTCFLCWKGHRLHICVHDRKHLQANLSWVRTPFKLWQSAAEIITALKHLHPTRIPYPRIRANLPVHNTGICWRIMC